MSVPYSMPSPVTMLHTPASRPGPVLWTADAIPVNKCEWLPEWEALGIEFSGQRVHIPCPEVGFRGSAIPPVGGVHC